MTVKDNLNTKGLNKQESSGYFLTKNFVTYEYRPPIIDNEAMQAYMGIRRAVHMDRITET
jgi:hypothetical protein